MLLNKLVEVKGYEAGSNGNLLVSLDNDLKIEGFKGDRSVNIMICVADVSDQDSIDALNKFIKDEKTPADKVIVVNDKFMKLPKKQKLALLKWENEKIKTPDEGINEKVEVVADVMTEKIYGRAARAGIHKATKFRLKGEKKVGKALHKEYRKEVKEEKNIKKGVARASKLFGRKVKDIEPDESDEFDDLKKSLHDLLGSATA